MEFVDHLWIGFAAAATPTNLLFCFTGALLGTLIGVLPGIGPAATLAMLLPVTFYLPPLGSLIMLAGIYYGAQYGGSTTAILVNLPGESSSVVTCLDGYAMAREGRAGAALAIAAMASFFAGTVATLIVALAAAPMTVIALSFGPAEYVSLMVFGLIGAVVLASGSVLSAVGMILIGILLGMIGTDVNSGAIRYSFGIRELYTGLDFVPVAVGIFGFAEIIANLENPETRNILRTKIGRLWPTREDFRRCWPAVLRGTGVGSLCGVLPGGGAVISSFASYSFEKKLARDPSRFGKGAVEGVAGPEAANNAGAQTQFIPMLTLGIPASATMALMIGAMTIQGIRPGPAIMRDNPELFWGLIASMWLGNLMLVIINLPLIGIWVRLLSIPYRLLYPAILLFCCIGVFSISNSPFDVAVAAGFGVFGYVARKLDCEPAPLLLGFVLGPMLEENFRRAMAISIGDYSVFWTRPISLGLLVLSALLLLALVLPGARRARQLAAEE
jgi:putative tricarboxylic transport membrane protein